MKKINNYLINIDFIRTLGIFGVVAIHTFNSIYERPDFFGGISWWYSILINSISRISIPLFIMISGYLLLNKDENFYATFKRIIKRLVIPLVAWTTITFATGNPKNLYEIFTLGFYERFFAGNVYYFYFLIILTGLYFMSPLFKSFLNTKNFKSQRLLGYLFIAVGIIETAEEYIIKNCSVENSFTKWVPFAGLFLMGYLIGNNIVKFKNKFQLKLAYLLGLITTLLLNYYYYSYGSVKILQTNYPGCLSHYADYYLSFNVVLMTLPAYAILFKIKSNLFKINFIKNLIYNIARNSFGIYLIHLFVVSVWDNWLKWTVDNTTSPLYIYVTFKFLGVFLISYLLISIIRKLPILKTLIGE